MNKPLSVIIKETKMKLIDACNESGLPVAILDLIIQSIYSEVHSLAEQQTAEEEVVYAKALRDNDIKNSNIILNSEGGDDETK